MTNEFHFPALHINIFISTRSVNDLSQRDIETLPLIQNIFILKQIRAEAAYLYDAVHLYADALVYCLENNGDPRNGTEIINAIKGRRYQSAMGYVLLLN